MLPFACLKFRTMYHDADRRQADLEGLNEASGALFKIREDPRVTRVGRLLRRFSLDELPQLINVMRGDMSLVGPRPLPQRDFERLEPWHRKRYLVLPGITGLWQVSGRSELDFDDLVRLDFLYLERWSVFLDLSILVKTVPAVVTRRGAF
jgi:lipopolysaccharide/colanic/teichoic acid biosynthesis glycosyltransferase